MNEGRLGTPFRLLVVLATALCFVLAALSAFSNGVNLNEMGLIALGSVGLTLLVL